MYIILFVLILLLVLAHWFLYLIRLPLFWVYFKLHTNNIVQNCTTLLDLGVYILENTWSAQIHYLKKVLNIFDSNIIIFYFRFLQDSTEILLTSELLLDLKKNKNSIPITVGNWQWKCIIIWNMTARSVRC